MTLEDLEHFPLAKAFLCEDCQAVGNCATRCPACASEAVLGLAGVLDKERIPYSGWDRLANAVGCLEEALQ